ncbi:MAG: DNA repair protein RecO [Cyanobacteria bacterium P01_D01_bin.73]
MAQGGSGGRSPYKVTGINLKSVPLGEADVILTVLTPERGLIRVVASGARKPKSKIGGRSRLFVVNQLLIRPGRNLDRIGQAELVVSYPGLSRDLGRLAAAQYWSELVLSQALSEQPQSELFDTLLEHLQRLDSLAIAPSPEQRTVDVLSLLCHGVYHLLRVAGVAPQVWSCGLTRQPVAAPAEENHKWRIGFSAAIGGTVSLGALNQASPAMLAGHGLPVPELEVDEAAADLDRALTGVDGPEAVDLSRSNPQASPRTRARFMPRQLTARELVLLQSLTPQTLKTTEPVPLSDWRLPAIAPRDHLAWIQIERALRHYAQYHLGKAIRSATLIDTYSQPRP